MSSESFILENYKRKSNLVKRIHTEFLKPIHENRIFLNLDGLRYNSDSIEFSNIEWMQNPQKFCDSHYGIYEFFPIILMVNNIPSVFLFTRENLYDNKILAPNGNFIRGLFT